MNEYKERKAITYKQSMSRQDLWRYVRAVGFPLGVFFLALFVIQSLAGFGAMLVAPLTAAMWALGSACAIRMASHRGDVLSETHATISIYLLTLFALKHIIAMMAGVSSEMLMEAFNQAIPATSGSAISGWLQNMMWITAIATPVGFIVMQVKRVVSFQKNQTTQKTFEGLRGIRHGRDEHLK